MNVVWSVPQKVKATLRTSLTRYCMSPLSLTFKKLHNLVMWFCIYSQLYIELYMLA